MQIGPDVYPDYHFLLIAPNLGAECLFDAAQQYWERYRPTVISNFRFPALIPPDRTITLTVIARRDIAEDLARQMLVTAPNAYYDPLTFDSLDEARAELNRRAEQSQPFGSPLSQPTATYDPNLPVIIPTAPPPPGFVTVTPVPTISVTAPPPEEPINPTPGPITGG